MRAARDRQELGQSLDQAEHDGLEASPARPSAPGYAAVGGEASPARQRPARIACPHAATVPRAHRPEGVAARTGHADLGPRHRRARGTRPAAGVRRGGRHAGRHRCRLRRRRVRGAARLAARRRRRPRRRRGRHQGRDRPGARCPRDQRVARLPDPTTLDASLRGSASTTSTSGRCTAGSTTSPSRRPCRALDYAVTSGRAAYVGVSNYTRLAERARRDLADAPSRAGRGSPRTRSSTPCSTDESRPRSCPPPRRSGWASCPGRRWVAGC